MEKMVKEVVNYMCEQCSTSYLNYNDAVAHEERHTEDKAIVDQLKGCEGKVLRIKRQHSDGIGTVFIWIESTKGSEIYSACSNRVYGVDWLKGGYDTMTLKEAMHDGFMPSSFVLTKYADEFKEALQSLSHDRLVSIVIEKHK